MARASAPTLIHGKVGNLIYRVRDGKQIIAQPPHKVSLKKVTPAFFLNRHEFAAAATIACDIYRDIRPNWNDTLGPVFRPYSHNYLTAKIKKAAQAAHKQRAKARKAYHYATEFLLPDTARALRDLDLGHEGAPATHVRMEPIGPQHNPTAIRVTGLQQAAQAILSHGNARLELRLHIRQANIRELVLDQEEGKWKDKRRNGPHPSNGLNDNRIDTTFPHTSAWIPVEILPEDGILLDIPPQEEDLNYVTVVLVEWREHRTVGRRIVRHHKMAIVRIAAIHSSPSLYTPPNPTPQADEDHDHEPPEIPHLDWRQDPKAYLAEALRRMQPT